MNGDRIWSVTLAHAWVRLYTRNAPPSDAADRREEVASDLFDQVAWARAAGVAESSTAWSLARRSLRGAPADLAWRLEVECVPGRLRWHVGHPSTILTVSLAMLIPLSVTADRLRWGENQWRAAGLVGLASWLTSALVASFALVALAHAVRRRGPVEGWSAGRLRRALVCTMSLCWAMSGVWRFAGPPLDLVAAVAWAGFGAALAAYLFVGLGGGAARLARRAWVSG